MKTAQSQLQLYEKNFWNFTSQLLANQDIAEACLAMQERYQLNINLLFFCIFLALENFHAITPENVNSIITRIDSWNRQVIFGLLSLSRFIKKYRNRKSWQELDAFYTIEKEILDNIEFASKTEQKLILPILTRIPKKEKKDSNKINNALANIFTYIKSQQISLHQNDLEKIYRILKYCFE